MEKCNHSEVDKIKTRGITKTWVCPKCGKVIVKQKITKNKAFGKAKILRTKEYGKNFVINYR